MVWHKGEVGGELCALEVGPGALERPKFLRPAHSHPGALWCGGLERSGRSFEEVLLCYLFSIFQELVEIMLTY